MSEPSGAYLSAAYGDKPAAYYAGARREWIDPLPVERELVVLELGCGDGATGALALRDGKCGRYVGVEMNPAAAFQARAVLSEVHTGNIDALELPYAAETFDLIICGDVLEHLVDPETTLRRLVPLLKIGGAVMASVPNIAHWQVIAGLMFGRFDYTAQGVMDRTHLRWFTPRTLRALFRAAGVQVDLVQALGWKRRSRVVTALFPLSHLLWRQIDLRGQRVG